MPDQLNWVGAFLKPKKSEIVITPHKLSHDENDAEKRLFNASEYWLNYLV